MQKNYFKDTRNLKESIYIRKAFSKTLEIFRVSIHMKKISSQSPDFINNLRKRKKWVPENCFFRYRYSHFKSVVSFEKVFMYSHFYDKRSCFLARYLFTF